MKGSPVFAKENYLKHNHNLHYLHYIVKPPQARHKILQTKSLITIPGDEERCRFQSWKLQWREQDIVIEFEVFEAEIINGAHVICIALSTAIRHRKKTVDFMSPTVALIPYGLNSFFCPQPADLTAYNE